MRHWSSLVDTLLQGIWMLIIYVYQDSHDTFQLETNVCVIET